MSSFLHGEPVDGKACLCCWDDLSTGTYVEYRTTADTTGAWLPCGYCQSCVQELLSSQWDTYVTALAKSTCRAETRRLVAKGPPTAIFDGSALPCPEGAEVHSLWYMSDNKEHSSKLEKALTGEEREKYWEELRKFSDVDVVVDE